MPGGFVGAGTVLNVATVVAGASLGMAIGSRLPRRVQTVVTTALGLVTLLLAGSNALSVADPSLVGSTPRGAPTLIVLGALLVGGIIGAALRLEERLESLAGRVQARLSGRADRGDSAPGSHESRERFIEGWLTASLLFCVGPLTILGALSDGMGRGIDQLTVKAVLDGFAALAFASSFGVGVLMAAASVAVVQGALTVIGMVLGALLPQAPVAALTATGGLLLAGVAIRLLDLRRLPVADLLPALAVAPALTVAVTAFA